MKEFFNTRKMVMLAVFVAMSVALYFVKIPLPFFPSFLTLNISEVTILIAAFMFGWVEALIVVVIRFLIWLPIDMGQTVGIGATTDLIIGIFFVLPVALFYKRYNNRLGAIIGLVIGVFVATTVAIIANRVVIINLYVKLFFGGSWDGLIGVLKPLFSNISRENFYNFYLWAAVLPFNLLKFILVSILSYLLYRALETIIKRYDKRIKQSRVKNNDTENSVVLLENTTVEDKENVEKIDNDVI